MSFKTVVPVSDGDDGHGYYISIHSHKEGNTIEFRVLTDCHKSSAEAKSWICEGKVEVTNKDFSNKMVVAWREKLAATGSSVDCLVGVHKHQNIEDHTTMTMCSAKDPIQQSYLHTVTVSMLTKEIATVYSQRYEVSLDEYWADLKTGMRSVTGTLEFSVKDDSLTIYKLIPGSKEKRRYEYCKLQLSECPSGEVQSLMLAELIDNSIELKQKIEQEVEENKKLKSDLGAFSKKMDEFVASKVELESLLYDRFLQLLNSKKEKITELQAQIDSAGPSPVKRQRPSPSESSDDADYDVETDVDSAGETNGGADDEDASTASNKAYVHSDSFSELKDL